MLTKLAKSNALPAGWPCGSAYALLGLALAALLLAPTARGASVPLYYSTTAGLLNWADSGGSSSWGTVSGGPYNTSAWSSGDTAVFEGTGNSTYVTLSGTATTYYGTAITGGLGFTVDGYTISASTPQKTLYVGNAGQASFITVASGKTATIGNYVKVSKSTSPLNSEVDLSGGGTLTIGSGSGTLGTSGGTFDLSAAGSGSGNSCYIGGGSTLNVASDGTVKYYSSLIVGGSGGPLGNAILNVNGGAFSVANGYSSGSLILGYDATQTATATVNLNSGSITTGSAGGGVRFGSSPANTTWTRTFNLNGGTLSTYQVYVLTAGNSSIFNFNGGTLKPLANTTFMTGLTTANVRNGGAIIDVAGKTITIGQALIHSGIGGDNATDGGLLVKDTVGGGALTLNNTETYTGPTVVAAGTLALGASGALNASSTIGIAPAATFDASALTTFTFGGSSSLLATGSVSSASFIKGGNGSPGISLNGQPATLQFAPTGFLGDSTHPALTVTAGTLSIGSSSITVVNNGGTPLGAGDYTLINVSGTGAISGTPTLNTSAGVGAGFGMAANTSVGLVQSSGSLVLHVTSSLANSATTIALHAGWSSTSTYGDALQFYVTVTGASPTGTVTVKDGGSGGTTIGTATLSGGSATITVSPLNGLTAGTHTNIVAVYGGDSDNIGSISSALASQTVQQKALTISNAAAIGKCYDGTTSGAGVTGSLNGVVSGDTVTLAGTGTYANAGPGVGIGVTSTSTLAGTAAVNYSLTQPTGLTANIVSTATWNVASGGIWGTAGNWLNGIIATNSGNTADFSTLDLTADALVSITNAITIGNVTFGNTDANPAANWAITNNSVSGNTLTLAGSSPTVNVNALGSGKNATIAAVVAGISGLTKTGSGNLVLNSGNTFTGNTVIQGGTVNFNGDTSFGTAPSSATPGSITLDGGAIAYTSYSNQSLNANRGVTVTANGGAISNAVPTAYILTVPGIIGGFGALTIGVASQAAVSLTGINTFGGGTVLAGAANGNVFCLVSSSGPAGAPTSGPFGTGTVTFNGPGTRSTIGGDITIGNPIIFAADTTFPTISSEKSLTFNGPITLSNGTRTLTVNIGATVPGKSLALAGVIDDGGNGYGLTKTGNGVLTLSGANTYSGQTAVSAGTLALSSGGSINNSAQISIAAGATFDVSAYSAYTLIGNITLSASGAASAATINGASGGTFNVGSQPIVFTDDGTDSHPALTVSQGTLVLNNNSITVNSSSPLASGIYTLVSQTSGSITANGVISLNAASSAIDNAHYGNLSVSGGNVILTVALKPTVTGKTYSRAPGTAVKIYASDLAATATVDSSLSYTATFDHCDATTANSVTLGNNGQTLGNSAIFIYPGNAANSNDSFSYTINDGHGGTVSGTVTININNNSTGQATINLAGQTATLGFFGIPGYHYVVQRSVNSLISWQDLTSISTSDVTPSGTSVTSGVITAPSGGAFTVTDPSPPANPTSVYYQLRAAQ